MLPLSTGMMLNMIMILLIALILVVIIRRLFGRTGSTEFSEYSQAPQQVTVNLRAANDPEVLDALADGNKIVAIKRYRELTGVGLKEAKDAVELIQANPFHYDDPDDVEKAKIEDTSKSGLLPVDAGIRDLIRSGRKIEAIKAYREFTGVGLKEAKDEIDRLEWEVRESASRPNGRSS